MSRALRIGLSVLVIANALSHIRAADVRLEPGALLTLEFPDVPDTLATMETGRRKPARLLAQLPANYSRAGKFPLFVFLNGGTGGRGDNLPLGWETVGSNDFICVNLPLFKRAPLDTNFWIAMPDFETMSRAYRAMLGKLIDTVPNVTPERSAFGGFSNGGHTVGVLLAGRDDFILNHFRAFYLLEGGFGPLAAHVLGSRTMKPYRFLIMRGDQPDDDPKYLPYFKAFGHLAQALEYSAQEQQLDFQYIVMKGYGHELPPKYRALLGQWVRGEKIVQPEKK
jgi:hypothetical protein